MQKQIDLGANVSLESIDAIKASLPDFPEEQIRECFQHNEVIVNEAIPSDFSKYFAIMNALAGGNIQGKRLLDIGAGLGAFVSQAKCLGMTPTGIDLFTPYHGACYQGAMCVFQAYGHSIEDAQRALVNQDATEMTSLENKFDFVTSIGMLEHVYGTETRKRIVQNMMKSLVPGGSLLLVCGPNKYFPFDLHHYGPKFFAYHCLPLYLKPYYLKLFAKKGQCVDPKWLNGIKVSEIIQSIVQIYPNTKIVQGFPLWVRLARSKLLQKNFVRRLVCLLAKLLSVFKMEPVIIIIATKIV
jgi:2-polyprenyl-3-methyl-5-hydroxy-6-metoxy-1,4-benzoquinol methylase